MTYCARQHLCAGGTRIAGCKQDGVWMLVEKKARSQRAALCGLFVWLGLTMATWVTRTPALRDALQASTEHMGMVLFGFALGSMLGILSANALLERWWARKTMAVGMVVSVLGLGWLAVGAGMASTPVVVAGFALFGVGMGWVDIAVNVEAGALERLHQRPLMTTLHGCFSLGAMLGALLGSAMAWLQVAVLPHLLGVAMVVLLGLWPLLRQVHNHSVVPSAAPTGVAPPQSHTGASGGFVLQAFQDRRVLWIGLFAFGLALTEGAAHDWLPLLMVDGYGLSETQSTLIYTLFTLGVMLARLSGNWLLQRFRRLQIMQVSAVLAACGVALVVFTQAPALGALAVLLWGLGSALTFPLALSAAAEGEGHSAQRVGAVAAMGYVSILVGPPALGFLGEIWGLRWAMLPVLVACLAALALTVRMRPVPMRVWEVRS